MSILICSNCLLDIEKIDFRRILKNCLFRYSEDQSVAVSKLFILEQYRQGNPDIKVIEEVKYENIITQ